MSEKVDTAGRMGPVVPDPPDDPAESEGVPWHDPMDGGE